MKDLEDIAAAEEDPGVRANASAKAAYSKERRSGYDPKAPKQGFKPALDLSEGLRNKTTGKLVFKDHPEFTPNLTPKQVIQAGTWGGCYFHPRGGKQGIRGPCAITHEEFPKVGQAPSFVLTWPPPPSLAAPSLCNSYSSAGCWWVCWCCLATRWA